MKARSHANILPHALPTGDDAIAITSNIISSIGNENSSALAASKGNTQVDPSKKPARKTVALAEKTNSILESQAHKNLVI